LKTTKRKVSYKNEVEKSFKIFLKLFHMSKVNCSNSNEWEDYGVDSLESCCSLMENYGYDALGCAIKMSIYFDDEELSNKTDVLMEMVTQKKNYSIFSLNTSRSIDRSAWCQHTGWKNGIY
jgi:hypothetical protein